MLKCPGNVKPVNSPDVDDDSAVGENINEASLEHPTLRTLLQYPVPHLRETRGLTRAKFTPKYNFPIKRPFILWISLLNAYLF